MLRSAQSSSAPSGRVRLRATVFTALCRILVKVNVAGGMLDRQLVAAFMTQFVDVFGHTQPDARSSSFELALSDNATRAAC